MGFNQPIIEVLRAMLAKLETETSSILNELMTVAALQDFYSLYGLYSACDWIGVLVAVEKGCDPSPLLHFLTAHKLSDLTTVQIVNAVRAGMPKSKQGARA